MENNVSYTDKERVTKWEVIDNLTKKIAECRGKAAYCQSKIDRNEPYLGDKFAEKDQYEREAVEADRLLKKILEEKDHE